MSASARCCSKFHRAAVPPWNCSASAWALVRSRLQHHQPLRCAAPRSACSTSVDILPAPMLSTVLSREVLEDLPGVLHGDRGDGSPALGQARLAS